MPAATPPDRNNPSFYRFPINNNRTGFKPVYLPMILIVPRRRNANGTTLGKTEVFDVKFFIADAPEQAKVAGPFNTGLLVPTTDIYTIPVNTLQLQDVKIDPEGRIFKSPTGELRTYEDVQEGDTFEYTTIRGNITSELPYYPDADYHDMSLFIIDVEDLPRPERYYFVWEAKYYSRVIFNPQVASAQGPGCIDESEIKTTQSKFLIAHPGEVHHEMFRKTPPLYFEQESERRADDRVLEFYRPFADILQDAFDEQTFINGINHINKIPAQLIPYLAFLIGWDLPNFPGVTDNVRRSILRQAVYLQKLKGSKRVLVELFDIFGFAIELVNLWYSTDGTMLVAPNEKLPDTILDEQIEVQTVCQNEPMVSDYSEPGFGQLEIPLVYTPTSDITITAFFVEAGPTKDALDGLVEQITADPDALQEQCILPGGAISASKLYDSLPTGDSTLISTTEITLDNETGVPTSVVNSDSPILINQNGISYNNIRNTVSIVFDRYFDFSQASLYVFATYPREKLIIPDSLENLRSNRFDVRILLKTGQEIPSELLEFLMQFIFKLKAFHSLLRKIVYDLNNYEVYNVIDYCITNPGVQVPPPVDESKGDVCSPDLSDSNLKDEDIFLRDAIYNGLLREFGDWKQLDGTHKSSSETEKYLNVPVNKPIGSECQFTSYGQERVRFQPDADFDHNPDLRPKYCSTTTETAENCFKGRVEQELDVTPDVVLEECVKCKPCVLGMGIGTYWTHPADAISNLRNGFGSYKGQNKTSYLGRRIFWYNHPEPKSLHFSNRPNFESFMSRSDRMLAYERPSLCIEKDNLNFPSHRLPSMSNLLEDYTSGEYRARPWDYSDNDLNARLGVNSAGDEYLVFDDEDLVYYGNGLLSDISSLGGHDDRDFLVTHKIWMVSEEGHPAIEEDSRIVITQEEVLTFGSSLPYGPIFRSANEDCSQDYRSGYPAQYGRYIVDLTEYDYVRDDQTDSLYELLGLPASDVTSVTSGTELLYTLGSQILVTEDEAQYRYYVPYRLDCDCLKYECETTDVTQRVDLESYLNVNTCPTNEYLLPSGNYDFNCDQLLYTPRVILEERFGSCSYVLDGTIPNMLCILDEGEFPDEFGILPNGSYYYKDQYGVIYEGIWNYKLDISGLYRTLDISYSIKSPGVWGEDPDGYLDGLAVFRKGIITNTRKVIRVYLDGSYEVTYEVCEQKIGFFQTNLLCGEDRYVDNFCFHLDCNITDEVDSFVLCGTRWTEVGDTQVEWPELSLDSSGVNGYLSNPGKVQPFIFMDVWNNDEAPLPTIRCVEADSTSGDIPLGQLPYTVIDASRTPPVRASTAVNGVNWERYTGFFFTLPDFDSLVPDASGVSNNFDQIGAPSDFYAFRWTCYINISKSGTYTFYTESDDGSQLFVDGALVVDNDGTHGLIEKSGSVDLSPGFHELVVTYFQLVGPKGLSVSFDGPDIFKTEIPDIVLYQTPNEWTSEGTTDCGREVLVKENVNIVFERKFIDPAPQTSVRVLNNSNTAMQVRAKFSVTGGRCVVSGDVLSAEYYSLDAGCEDLLDFSFPFVGEFPCCDIVGDISLEIECCQGEDFLKSCDSDPDEIYDIFIDSSDLTVSPEGTDYTTRLEQISVSPTTGRQCLDGTDGPNKSSKIIKYNFINLTSKCVQVLMRHVEPGTDTVGADVNGDCPLLRDSPSDGGTELGCGDLTLSPSGYGGATNFICLCPNNKIVSSTIQYHMDSISGCCDNPKASFDIQVEARSVTLLDGTVCGDSGILDPCVSPCT